MKTRIRSVSMNVWAFAQVNHTDECMVTAVIKSNGHGLALEVGGVRVVCAVLKNLAMNSKR